MSTYIHVKRVINATGVQCRCPSARTDNDRRCKVLRVGTTATWRQSMFMKCRYHDTATSYAVYSQPLPARTGYERHDTCRDIWMHSSRRANIIRVTSPRRYSAEDLRWRDLVTMSRVRDGWRSHPSVTLRNIRM